MEAWGAHGGSAIHTGTHFGSPPACAALLATLDAVRVERLAERAERIGDSFRGELAAACGDRARVRGRVLMIGVELADAPSALAIARALLAAGYIVLTGGSRGATLTLSPPLTIAPELLGAFASALSRALA
jgi:4-aminobutyrate aminotransferase/(S)-3-amino-2-methylpropionate transaminase